MKINTKVARTGGFAWGGFTKSGRKKWNEKGLLQKHVKSAAAPYRQKNFQRLRRKPGITTIRKKAQLTRVKTLMNSPPLPGYSRT